MPGDFNASGTQSVYNKFSGSTPAAVLAACLGKRFVYPPEPGTVGSTLRLGDLLPFRARFLVGDDSVSSSLCPLGDAERRALRLFLAQPLVVDVELDILVHTFINKVH